MTATFAAVVLMAAGMAWAQEKPAEKPAAKEKPMQKAEMKGHEAMAGQQMFLVMSPHTPEECLSSLDAVQAKGPGNLAQWEWGCKAGDHTGYLMIHAASADAALAQVPEDMRAKAKVLPLNKFTEADLKKFHEMMQK